MDLLELEEALQDIFSSFSIETTKRGEIVIHTNLRQDDDGELVDMDEESDEDMDFDPNFEPLEEDDASE